MISKYTMNRINSTTSFSLKEEKKYMSVKLVLRWSWDDRSNVHTQENVSNDHETL